MKRASSVGFDKRYVEGFYAMSVRLSKCTGIRWEVDHVIPLIAGGPHHESNLQVITMKKNRSKYDR